MERVQRGPQDHLHCGHGVRKWDSVEVLYSFTALSASSYPFILQPFIEGFTDVRVIVVNDYIEAYTRFNPDNFRMNISSGGKSSPYPLGEKEQEFCMEVMKRGRFPYAHIDLHVMKNKECYLSEISLNGGIKGAAITRKELDNKKELRLEALANQVHG